jgi:hypothetical protein
MIDGQITTNQSCLLPSLYRGGKQGGEIEKKGLLYVENDF